MHFYPQEIEQVSILENEFHFENWFTMIAQLSSFLEKCERIRFAVRTLTRCTFNTRAPLQYYTFRIVFLQVSFSC